MTDTTSIWTTRSKMKWQRDPLVMKKKKVNHTIDDDDAEVNLFESTHMMEIEAKKIDDRIKKEDEERAAAPTPESNWPSLVSNVPFAPYPQPMQPFDGGMECGRLPPPAPPRPVARVGLPPALPLKMRLARERNIRENKRQAMKKELFLLQVRHRQLQQKLEKDDLTSLPDTVTETETEAESEYSDQPIPEMFSHFAPPSNSPFEFTQFIPARQVPLPQPPACPTPAGTPVDGDNLSQDSKNSTDSVSNVETVPTSGAHHLERSSETDETSSSTASEGSGDVRPLSQQQNPAQQQQQQQQHFGMPHPHQYPQYMQQPHHHHHHHQHQFGMPPQPYQMQNQLRHHYQQQWDPYQNTTGAVGGQQQPWACPPQMMPPPMPPLGGQRQQQPWGCPPQMMPPPMPPLGGQRLQQPWGCPPQMMPPMPPLGGQPQQQPWAPQQPRPWGRQTWAWAPQMTPPMHPSRGQQQQQQPVAPQWGNWPSPVQQKSAQSSSHVDG